MNSRKVLEKESFEMLLKKGAKGEQVILERLNNLGLDPIDLTDYSKHKKEQQMGLDFTFTDPDGSTIRMRGDSKANVQYGAENNLGVHFVELYKTTKNGMAEGWFKSSSSDYIFPYCVNTGRSFYYKLKDLRKVIFEAAKKDPNRIKMVKNGAYGVWWPLQHYLIKELK